MSRCILRTRECYAPGSLCMKRTTVMGLEIENVVDLTAIDLAAPETCGQLGAGQD